MELTPASFHFRMSPPRPHARSSRVPFPDANLSLQVKWQHRLPATLCNNTSVQAVCADPQHVTHDPGAVLVRHVYLFIKARLMSLWNLLS